MEIKRNKILKEYTTFKIGGKCDYFFSPENFEGVLNFFKFVKDKDIPFFILGGGSNLLVSDEGFKGGVLHCGKLNNIVLFSEKGNEVILKVEGGTLVKDLLIFCSERGFSGLEEFYGLPGSVGGAVFMNARCYGKEFSDVVVSVDVFDIKNEEILNLKKSEIFSGYKKTIFQKKGEFFILNVYFKLNRGASREKILEKMVYYINDREKKGQFEYPNAGCVFKNNRKFGKPTGMILEELGFKGVKKGGVKFFEKHANFIVNFDNGKAEDVIYLIELAKRRAYENLGIELETEISFLGNF